MLSLKSLTIILTSLMIGTAYFMQQEQKDFNKFRNKSKKATAAPLNRLKNARKCLTRGSKKVYIFVKKRICQFIKKSLDKL